MTVPLHTSPSRASGDVAAPPAARPSVCFVAPNAYAALTAGEDVSHVGGAERQQVLLAHELVRRGHRVSFVTLDHGQPDGHEVHGIRMFTCYRPVGGIPKLRFLHPRLTGLWRAMARANADIYYQRGAAAETGLVAYWCARHARRFAFGIAHDTNCMRALPLLSRGERVLFRYGLRRADVVIAQTLQQQRLVRKDFGIAAPVVPSCCAWTPDLAARDDTDGRRDSVLWAGRLSKQKRPDWIIRLAEDLPQQRFDVVGQCNAGSAYGQSIATRLASLPNVRWHGYVPHAGMSALYREARVVLCTSESEGFPNVFLEAWSCGRPVLTTVDPDDVVATFHLGHVGADYAAIRDHLATLDGRRRAWEAAGTRGIDYVRRYHGARVVGDAMSDVLRRCAEARVRADDLEVAKEGR